MDTDELLRENRALRSRLSSLSEASLHINASLEFETVLQGVLDSACALTDARCGVLALFDDTGDIQPEGSLTSGVSPAEMEKFWEVLTGSEYCDYFEQLPGPKRHADLQGHLASLGFPGFRLPLDVDHPVSFLGVVLRYAGEPFGAIYMVEKKSGPEFTAEDEETLVMFASQAVMVIANARKYQDERKARADLETLVQTSPVGVLVFDARTGALVSSNQEVMRMAGSLTHPGQSPGELMPILTVRRDNGQEVSADEAQLIQSFSGGETVRAEEVVLSVPDGRSLTVLLNATPNRSDDGQVETYVVTLQDMTSLQEMERLRAEFLAMVSHELRTPLTTVKGSIATLIDPPATLNPTETRQFHQIIDRQIDRMHVLISDLLDVARIDTGTLAVSPEPTDVALLVGEARNSFRSGGSRHSFHIDIEPDLPWVMADRLRMMQVLCNLLANAARHSPESSPIKVSAFRTSVHVAVSVSDEGRGIPAESLPHLFRKFSRIDSEEQGGDTGLGLAICKGLVEAHGGRIWAESDGPGLGARFTFTIPTVEEAGFVSPGVAAQPAARSYRRRGVERMRILAIDDDPQTLRYVREALNKSDYEPMVTANPGDALRLIEEGKPQLVLLDLMLPGTDGIELMKEIMDASDVPVIFLSAYGQDRLVARAFDMGAADYVVKPFSATELTARIRAALRRRVPAEPRQPYVLGSLTIDYAERRVAVAGRPVQLTAIEYRMLTELSSYGGRVLTYEHLLRRVWGLDGDADVRPMRTVVRSLRRKLGDDAEDPSYIFTDLRVGYRMPKGQTREAGPIGLPEPERSH